MSSRAALVLTVLISWSLALTPRALAEDLTLARALELALSRNRAVASAEARVVEQEASLRGSKAQRWPALELSQRLVRIDASTVDRANSAAEALSLLIGVEIPPFVFQDSYRTQLDLAVPLWTSGGLAAAIDADRERLNASRADRESTGRAIRVAVVRRFFALASAREVRPARAEALRSAERRLAEAEHRLEVGLTTRQEVLRWKVRVERALADLSDLEADEMVARLELADLLEVAMRGVGDPVVPGSETVGALLAWADRLEPAAVLRRTEAELDDLPEVRSARARLTAAGEQVRGARSARRPRLDAAASYGWLENDTLELDEFSRWSGSLLLTIPLDARGDLRAQVARGEARQRLAEAAVSDARAAMRLAIGRALADVLRARGRLRSARRAEEEAAARRELLARQAGVGVVSLLDLIDADTTLVAAEVARATTRVDLLRAVAVLEVYWPAADPPAGGLIP